MHGVAAFAAANLGTLLPVFVFLQTTLWALRLCYYGTFYWSWTLMHTPFFAAAVLWVAAAAPAGIVGAGAGVTIGTIGALCLYLDEFILVAWLVPWLLFVPVWLYTIALLMRATLGVRAHAAGQPPAEEAARVVAALRGERPRAWGIVRGLK